MRADRSRVTRNERRAPRRVCSRRRSCPRPASASRWPARRDRRRQASTLHAARPGGAARLRAANRTSDLGFMARLLALCSLPRTDPKKPTRVQASERDSRITLYMVAGGGNKLPYGTVPRLLLASVCTEAVRTQSPELILGDSLSEFMRKVGVYGTSGDKHTRLRNQMRRLLWMHGLAALRGCARGSHAQRADCPSHGAPWITSAPTACVS